MQDGREGCRKGGEEAATKQGRQREYGRACVHEMERHSVASVMIRG